MPPTASSQAAITRRRRAFESAIAEHFGNNATSSSSSPVDPAVTLSDSAVATLVPCLEEFLRLLSNELAANDDSDGPGSQQDKKTHVSPRHVMDALERMGFGDLAKEANQVIVQQQQQTQDQKPKASKKKRKAEFSQEQADAQELLLSASRRKMEGES